MLGGDDHDLIPHGDQMLGGDDHDKVPHVPITGGLKPVDTKTKEVQAALAFAVARMNSMENFLYLRKASNIGSVTSQVVAGMAYYFRQVELAATECSKLLSRKPQNADCPISNSMANVRVCDFDVYDKAWMTTRYTLANMVCKAKPLIGGDDHDVQPHGDQVLGGDDLDLIPHGDQVLGGDDHDLVPHGDQVLGGNDHDFVPDYDNGGEYHHLGDERLGGDDHDKVPHGKPLLGGDDHDYQPHGKQ